MMDPMLGALIAAAAGGLLIAGFIAVLDRLSQHASQRELSQLPGQRAER
jgi:hypothetical protein